jgi:hypothetical protein
MVVSRAVVVKWVVASALCLASPAVAVNVNKVVANASRVAAGHARRTRNSKKGAAHIYVSCPYFAEV